MSSKRPKIQAYVKQELYERFVEWKRSKGIRQDSEAINVLFAEVFSPSISAGDSLSESLLKLLLANKNEEPHYSEIALLRGKLSA
ncbi:MAG: hypothetical protein F6K14_08465 [Symploca sp. SIO2C1]|nr:hypothetical protein [Symploca sp. SIO2C1]